MNNKLKLIILVFVLVFQTSNLVIAQSQLDQQLKNVNEQIEDLRNQQPPRSNWSDSFSDDVQGEKKENSSKTIGYILAVLLISFWTGSWLYSFTRPQNIENRRKEKERKQKEKIEKAEEAEKMRKIVQQIKQQEVQTKAEDERERYKKWRTELQKMPKYETWRQQVFSKCGRFCERNGEGCLKTEKLEIHHSKKSLHLIYKEEGFDWIMVNKELENALDKAIGSRQLWDVDNGSVLCHVCHERQDSSQFFLEKNK